jgi:hypothetical protein
VGHTFPFEQLTIRDGLSVCPVCDQLRSAPRRSTWSRTALAHPLLLLAGAALMLFLETISGIGIGATYQNQHVGGAGWLTAGSIVSLVGVAVVIAAVIRLVVAVRAGSWTRSLLAVPLMLIAVGAGLLAAGDLVEIGLNVAFVNASQPGAGWQLFGQVFDTLFFAGLAGVLGWTAVLSRRPDPVTP